jgi:hypothetical protein
MVDGKTGLGSLDKTEISCPFRQLNHDSSVAQPAAYSLQRLRYPGLMSFI